MVLSGLTLQLPQRFIPRMLQKITLIFTRHFRGHAHMEWDNVQGDPLFFGVMDVQVDLELMEPRLPVSCAREGTTMRDLFR